MFLTRRRPGRAIRRPREHEKATEKKTFVFFDLVDTWMLVFDLFLNPSTLILFIIMLSLEPMVMISSIMN